MAGRGCTITITILPSTVNDDSNIIDQTQEINLPVALHSPLEILRDQIERLTSIIVTDQVLILCDLSDPERNSDILLDGRNHVSLRDCGIRNGSNLTLHALGLSAEKRMKLLKEAIILNNNKTKVDQLPPALLNTKISAADANHSYNGVIFDIQVKGPHEVEINSISIAGMLGPVCIYARDREWAIDNDDEPSPHWWAHRESISQTGWTLVAKVDCLPSWDKPYEIMFNKPFRMLPHSKHGFYCHSSLPDDLGIQYQSYQPGDIIAEDDVLKILPGLGHTGSLPFDNHHGWYRAYRGLAGRVSYSAKIKGWTVDEHDLFPVELKQGVKTMLLAHYHCESHNDSDNNSSNNYQQQQQQSKQRRLDAQANNDNNNNNDVDIDVDKDYDDLPALLDLYTASGKRNQYTVKNSNSSSSNSDNVSDDSKDCSQKMAVVQDSGFNNDNENSNSTYATTVESSSSSSSFSPPPPLSSPLILSPPISPRSTSSILMGSFKNSVLNRLSPSSSTTSASTSAPDQVTATTASSTATSTETAATSAATPSTTPRNRFYGMKTAVFKPPPVNNRAPIFPSLSPRQYNNTNNNTSSKSTSSNSNNNIVSSSKSYNDRTNDYDSMMMMTSSSSKRGNESWGSNKSAKNNFHYDLPKFILYNIMEFMHWDWFLDVAIPPPPRPPTVRSKTRAFVDSVTAHATNAVAAINSGTATASTTNGFELMNLIQMLGLQHELTFFHGGAGGQNNTNTNNQNDDEDDDNDEEDEEDNDGEYMPDEEEEDEDEEEEEYDDEEVMEEEGDSDDDDEAVEEEEEGGSDDDDDVMVESHQDEDED